MTTRAADDFGAIRARMQELQAEKTPPTEPAYQGATPIIGGRVHLCSLHNHSGTCGICGKPSPKPVPPVPSTDDEIPYMGGW